MSAKNLVKRYLAATGWKSRELARRLAALPCEHRPLCTDGCSLYEVHYSSLYRIANSDRDCGLEVAWKLERGTKLLHELGETTVPPLDASKLCPKAVRAAA